MAKKIVEQDDNGKIVSYRQTKALKKSEARLIGWTPGPQTRAQRIKRDLIG